jgi:hypothetical protein
MDERGGEIKRWEEKVTKQPQLRNMNSKILFGPVDQESFGGYLTYPGMPFDLTLN